MKCYSAEMSRIVDYYELNIIKKNGTKNFTKIFFVFIFVRLVANPKSSFQI